MADEAVDEPLVGIAEGPQEDEQAEPALASHPRPGGDLLAGLGLDVELDPFAPVGVDGPGDDGLQIAAGLEDHPGGPHELGYHHPLGAVDDEGPLVRHHREVPHEDGLLLDLAGVGVLELGAHEDRRGVGHVFFFALLHRELRRRAQVLVSGVELQDQLERSGEVLDRTDIAECVRQSLLEEPLERVTLDRDEVRQRQDFIEVGEGETLPGRGTSGQGLLLRESGLADLRGGAPKPR